jgi:hypothetical protein
MHLGSRAFLLEMNLQTATFFKSNLQTMIAAETRAQGGVGRLKFALTKGVMDGKTDAGAQAKLQKFKTIFVEDHSVQGWTSIFGAM